MRKCSADRSSVKRVASGSADGHWSWKTSVHSLSFCQSRTHKDKGFCVMILSAYEDHVISDRDQKISVVLTYAIQIVPRYENISTK